MMTIYTLSLATVRGSRILYLRGVLHGFTVRQKCQVALSRCSYMYLDSCGGGGARADWTLHRRRREAVASTNHKYRCDDVALPEVCQRVSWTRCPVDGSDEEEQRAVDRVCDGTFHNAYVMSLFWDAQTSLYRSCWSINGSSPVRSTLPCYYILATCN